MQQSGSDPKGLLDETDPPNNVGFASHLYIVQVGTGPTAATAAQFAARLRFRNDRRVGYMSFDVDDTRTGLSRP
jgi:hypothetical protein